MDINRLEGRKRECWTFSQMGAKGKKKREETGVLFAFLRLRRSLGSRRRGEKGGSDKKEEREEMRRIEGGVRLKGKEKEKEENRTLQFGGFDGLGLLPPPPFSFSIWHQDTMVACSVGELLCDGRRQENHLYGG